MTTADTIALVAVAVAVLGLGGGLAAVWADLKARLATLEAQIQAVKADVAQHANGPAQLAAIRVELDAHDRRVQGLEKRVERATVLPWRSR